MYYTLVQSEIRGNIDTKDYSEICIRYNGSSVFWKRIEYTLINKNSFFYIVVKLSRTTSDFVQPSLSKWQLKESPHAALAAFLYKARTLPFENGFSSGQSGMTSERLLRLDGVLGTESCYGERERKHV